MTNLQSIFQRGAVTSSVCKQIKRWVRGFTRQDLEFFACYHPTEPWKKLADICHLSPKKVGYVVNQSDILDRELGPGGDSPNQGCRWNHASLSRKRVYPKSLRNSDRSANPDCGNLGLILGLRPANERRRYKVTPSLIGWAQT